MQQISLTLNGKPVDALVSPRTHLGDFLREDRLLTGTHLGCEHGVCGACTVEIDGQISRACITLAVMCDGASVQTIEGFDDDPLMAKLRTAFTAEHALQCGYCTPGMLIAARDLIRRRGQLDTHAIRVEMSGNLCRCTGYDGIVRAISRVMASDKPLATTLPRSDNDWLGPRPGADYSARTATLAVAISATEKQVAPSPLPFTARTPVDVTTGPVRVEAGRTHIAQDFDLPYAREAVWPHLADLSRAITLLPGAALDAPIRDDGTFDAHIALRLGPIKTQFAGAGRFTTDPAAFTLEVDGRGRDHGSRSSADGQLSCQLTEPMPNITRVALTIAYRLTGPLAQFGRPGLVHGLVASLGTTFAENLAARVAGEPETGADGDTTMSVRLLLWNAAVGPVRRWLRQVLGRSRP